MRKCIKSMYQKIDTFALKADLKRRRDSRCDWAKNLPQSPLSSDEVKAIRELWGERPLWGGKELYCYGFYKWFCGSADAHYVPDDFYDYAEHVLNLRWAAYFLQHKSNLKYIVPAQNRAKVLLQKIDGHFVLEDNSEITPEEAARILRNCPMFMAKVARGTGGGAGVRKIVWDEAPNKEALLKEIMSPIDMEYEHIIHQNEFMAQFNPDSVNTFRFVTLNINGKCTVLSTFLRMGAKGSIVDNLSGGHGYLIGINQNGDLYDFGIDKHYKKQYEAPTGLQFKGISVPGFENIKQQVIDFHKTIPYANLIGWDVTLDESGNVVIIEVNLDSAIIRVHQIFNGPIFGDRLEEVMAYIKEREPLLRHQMMIY